MKTLIFEIIAAAGTIDSTGKRVLKPFGLTPMTFNILTLLHEGPLSQRAISDQIIVAASSITFQVRQLQKKGLIQRRRADARTWLVSLTALGEAKRAEAEARMNQILDQLQIAPGLQASAEAALKAVNQQLPILN